MSGLLRLVPGAALLSAPAAAGNGPLDLTHSGSGSSPSPSSPWLMPW